MIHALRFRGFDGGWCRITALVTSVLVTGCASQPAKPTPPPLITHVFAYPGTPLTNPQDQPVPEVSPDRTIQVAVDWIALERMPDRGLQPIDSQARLTLAPASGAPVVQTSQHIRRARFGRDEESRRFLEALSRDRLGSYTDVGGDHGLIVPGATLHFEMQSPPWADADRIISIAFSPTSKPDDQQADNVALVSVGITAVGTPPSDDDATAQDSPSPLQELALIDHVPYDDGTKYVMAAPFSVAGTSWKAIAAVVSISNFTDSAENQIAIGALQEQLEGTQSAQLAMDVQQPAELSKLNSALMALREGSAPRPPLLYLTSVSAASVAGDLVLVADEKTLSEFAELTMLYTSPKAMPSLDELQWFFDRTALQIMGTDAMENSLSPELTSVLAQHAGDLASRPDAIVELLKSMQSSKDLSERIVAENYIALEDSAPAARVRAFDWLKSRSRAPEGFDPLADARSRRAAIDKALNP